MKFRRRRGGVRAELDEHEATILRQCAAELLALLGPPAPEQDPLAELVGMPAGDVAAPQDPALARLLPDAYGDDPAAAREFRRYTDEQLRSGKRAAARTFLDTLPAGRGPVVLSRDEAAAWLGCLNDLRLVLGARLEVTEDLDLSEVDPADPAAQVYAVYGWLAFVQESLLGCLDPRPS